MKALASDVAFSIGDGLRPGSIADAKDEARRKHVSISRRGTIHLLQGGARPVSD